MTIHDTGYFSVSKLAEKHYVIYFEDENEIKQVKSYTNEASALKACDKLAKEYKG